MNVHYLQSSTNNTHRVTKQRFSHAPTQKEQSVNNQSGNRRAIVYSIVEGTAVIGGLYGLMSLTESNPEYFSKNPGMKVLLSTGCFILHQLSHLGLLAYGYHLGKRAQQQDQPSDKSNETPKTRP